MATLQNSCSACYKAQAPECCEYYLIGGLVPGTEYHVTATDTKGRVYDVDVDGEPVDENGNLKIVFPDGVNTVAQGNITIQLFLGSDLAQHLSLCNPQTLTTCDGEFTCIELAFYKMMPSPAPYWEILCLCDETPECDGMCGVPENDYGIDTITGVLTSLADSLPDSGAYLHVDAKIIILINDNQIVNLYTCCNGIAPFYKDPDGPYIFNEEDMVWEPLISYQPINADFGVSITIGGTIPDFSTGVMQVSTDSGATWGSISNSFTKDELAEGITVNTALTSYRSRLVVTLPNGCSYNSAENTLTE